MSDFDAPRISSKCVHTRKELSRVTVLSAGHESASGLDSILLDSRVPKAYVVWQNVKKSKFTSLTAATRRLSSEASAAITAGLIGVSKELVKLVVLGKGNLYMPNNNWDATANCLVTYCLQTGESFVTRADRFSAVIDSLSNDKAFGLMTLSNTSSNGLRVLFDFREFEEVVSEYEAAWFAGLKYFESIGNSVPWTG